MGSSKCERPTNLVISRYTNNVRTGMEQLVLAIALSTDHLPIKAVANLAYSVYEESVSFSCTVRSLLNQKQASNLLNRLNVKVIRREFDLECMLPFGYSASK